MNTVRFFVFIIFLPLYYITIAVSKRCCINKYADYGVHFSALTFVMSTSENIELAWEPSVAKVTESNLESRPTQFKTLKPS